MLIGIFAGVFFFLSFVYYQKSVKNDGVGLAGVFSKLGILLPMVLSILLWREYPTEIQWIGIALAILSIIVVNFPFGKDWKKALRVSLILLFVYGGIAEFSNKLFQKYALLEFKPFFLFFIFFTAFVISLFFTIRSGKGFSFRAIIIGIMVGIPNLFSSYFLINALDQLKTAVVFPVFSAGSIVVISLGGLFIFKERLNKKEVFAIIMTIFALILINIK
jgi:multidrug transporter EmrE-like cation transporter